MPKCVFCDIVSGKEPSYRVWEDADFVAFLDSNPVRPGHTLLIPKKHVEYVFDLPEPLYSKLFKTAKLVAQQVQKTTKAKRVGLTIEGFKVPHACLHLIPINKENELLVNRSNALDVSFGPTIIKR